MGWDGSTMGGGKGGVKALGEQQRLFARFQKAACGWTWAIALVRGQMRSVRGDRHVLARRVGNAHLSLLHASCRFLCLLLKAGCPKRA